MLAEYGPSIALFILCFEGAIELILDFTWNSWYFRHGIPVFNVQFPAKDDFSSISTDALDEQFKGSVLASVLFKYISEDEIAFRQKMFQFPRYYYPSAMHCIIRFNGENKTVKVTGYANYYVILGPFLYLYWVFSRFSGFNRIGLVGILVFLFIPINYFTQSHLILRVKDHLEKVLGAKDKPVKSNQPLKDQQPEYGGELSDIEKGDF